MTNDEVTEARNDNGLAEALRRAAEEVVDAPETKRLLDAYDDAPPSTPPWVVEVRNDGHEDRAWTLSAPEAAVADLAVLFDVDDGVEADANAIAAAVNNYRRLLVSNRALHVLLAHAEGGRLLAVQKYEAAREAWLGTREEMGEYVAGLAEAFDSLRSSMVTMPQDWALDHRAAWQYGIVVGWGDALPVVAARHGWDDATVARLRRMREAVATAKRDADEAAAAKGGAA